MLGYDSDPYKTDDASHDACPTCGGRVVTTGRIDAAGCPAYTTTCTECPWDLDLDGHPADPRGSRDHGRLLTDGGTTTDRPADAGPQTARDILDELHSSDPVSKLSSQIQTGRPVATGEGVRRALALSEDRLVLTVEHETGIEYIWLADGWQSFVAVQVRERDGAEIDAHLDTVDVDRRLSKPIDIELVGSTPIERPNLSQGEE